MEMEKGCLTCTDPGIKNCFCLHGIFLGDVQQFEINVINAFYKF